MAQGPRATQAPRPHVGTAAPKFLPLAKAGGRPGAETGAMSLPARTEPDPTAIRRAHLAMVEALLAGSGLARVAEIAARGAGTPVAVVIPRLEAAVVRPEEHGHDVARVVGYVESRLAGRPQPVPDGVSLEVPVQAGDEVWGSVLALGPGAADASEYLSVAAIAALTEVAIAEARMEAEDTVRGHFVEEVRAGRTSDPREIVQRARRLGCDLGEGAVAVCAEVTSGRPRHVAALIAGEHARALVQVVDERLFAVLGAAGEGSVRGVAERVAARLEPYAVVGVSSLHSDPADLRRALEEAELLCDVARNGGPAARDAAGRSAYRLLARLLASHPDELRAFYEETVEPIVRYDAQYRTDLAETLRTYLARDCNMNATAAAVHAHRHTIAYRLERVAELTGLDPTRSEDRERLGIGLKAHELLEPRLPR